MAEPTYELYVIPGSHACRSAMLMLDHKDVSYRRVDVPVLLHPVASRLHGFDAGGQTRTAGGRRTLGLRLGDRLGTVPGLAAGDERISTNYRIARFLDDRHPEPPLFPADGGRRRAVEGAEAWANDTLQMATRRIVGAAFLHDPEGLSRSTGAGRLGYLLYRRASVRRFVVTRILCRAFAINPAPERDPAAELPAMLDRVDAWIDDGVIGTDEPNAADFMIAPSLALILYRPDVRPMFDGRPALQVVDRLLPEPAGPQEGRELGG